MLMVSLREGIGTSYFIADFAQAVSLFLKEQSDGTVIDLARCKFGPLCLTNVEREIPRLVFTDSENEAQDAILKHNREVVLNSWSNPKTVPLNFRITDEGELINYIKDLKEDVLYSVEDYLSDQKRCFAMLSVIQLLHPNINIDLGYAAQDYFQFVRQYWLLGTTEHCDAYLEVRGSGILTTEVRDDGTVYVPGTGFVKEFDYVDAFPVLPAYFGSKVIDVDDLMGEFTCLFEESAMILSNVKYNKPKLASYLNIV